MNLLIYTFLCLCMYKLFYKVVTGCCICVQVYMRACVYMCIWRPEASPWCDYSVAHSELN